MTWEAIVLLTVLAVFALVGLIVAAATVWDWLTYPGPGRSAADPDKETPPEGWNGGRS
jgi:hypothetical protein